MDFFVYRKTNAPPAKASRFRNNDKYLRVLYDENISSFVVEHLGVASTLSLN